MAAVASMTAAWWALSHRAELPLQRVLLGGAVVHLAALGALPYLSGDPYYYSAIGHAMAAYHQSPTVPFDRFMRADDPFLMALGPDWRRGVSPYGWGFNELASWVASVGGEDPRLHLHLYQALGALALLGAAWLTGRAAHRAGQSSGRAAALVAFCPLAVIEATQSAHNDALLALVTALFVYLWMADHRLGATGALAAGLAIKLSGGLLLALSLVARPLGAIALRRRHFVLFAAVLMVLALLGGARFGAAIGYYTGLIGNPHAPEQYCTMRAIECLPRSLLRMAHQYVAAWTVGLMFRVFGAVWLVYAAWRAGREPHRHLAWCATGLFVYYLYLHGWQQSWYLLPLLPLLPFADVGLFPAMAIWCVGAVAYYAFKLPFDCQAEDTLGKRLAEVTEAALVLGPASLLLIRSRRVA